MLISGGLIAAVLIAAGTYLGLFSGFAVTEGEPGPFVFVYREMRGTSMSEVGKITSDLNAILEDRGIRRRPLDAFFPDGSAQIGFEVTGADETTLAALGPAMKRREVAAERSMTVTFPWRNRLSFIVGAMKTDPAFAKYRAQHGLAKAEAYLLNAGDTILYFQPIRQTVQR
jgi:hypothetical protein